MKFDEHEVRYERKFRTAGISQGRIQSVIKLNPAGFCEHHTPRQINNIYFDTPDLHRFVQNLDGERDRSKVRIRWYGDRLSQVEKPVLEVKVKRGLLGFKERVNLPAFRVDETLDRRTIRRLLDSKEVPPHLSLALRSVEMTLMNSYKRTYFVSRDRRFRLTMDTDQVFCNVSRLSNNIMASSSFRDEVVLELKYGQEADDLADRITNAFPFRMTKNSKYATGVQRVCLW